MVRSDKIICDVELHWYEAKQVEPIFNDVVPTLSQRHVHYIVTQQVYLSFLNTMSEHDVQKR